jgi:hypothetical protein
MHSQLVAIGSDCNDAMGVGGRSSLLGTGRCWDRGQGPGHVQGVRRGSRPGKSHLTGEKEYAEVRKKDAVEVPMRRDRQLASGPGATREVRRLHAVAEWLCPTIQNELKATEMGKCLAVAAIVEFEGRLHGRLFDVTESGARSVTKTTKK